MPKYEIDLNGQKFEIEAPDDQALSVAVKQLQQETATSPEVDGGGIAGALNSFGTGIADMASFGLADEVGAGARWLGGKVLPWQSNVSYDEALQEVRQKDKASAESNPGSYLAGQITGGVGTASQLAKGGLTLTGRLAPTAGLGKRVLAGAAEGGLFGGAYGLGSGEGATDRLTQGAVNAGLGAVVGGAVPLVASGVSSGYRSLMDGRAADEAARKAGVRPEVARMITETLEADGSLGSTGMANMQRAGKEAMLADAGPNARSVLDASIQRGGRGSVNARSAIDQRVSRGAQDLTAALDQSLGVPQGVEATREAIRTGSRGARQAAYEGPTGAYAQAIDYADPRGQAIEQLVKGRVPASAIRRANELMRVMGEESQQILAKVADDGSVTFETLPDVRQLDYITRALNDVAESGEGAGAMGGVNALGRAYKDLSRDIRSTLRDLVPEYGKALDTAADPIRRAQAVELGSKILSPSMARDEVAQAVRGMSQAEKDAVAQGTRSRIDDAVANVTRAIQDGNMEAREGVKALRDLSSRANREKLTTVIGAKAKPLFEELDRIATSFDLRASVAENSKTFARQAVSGRIDDVTAPGAIGKAAQGEPIGAMKRVVQALTGQTPEKITARQNEIYSEISDFLTRPADQAIPAFGAMQNYGTQTLANQVRAQEIARFLAGGRPLAYPASGLSSKKIRQ
jgi:hypothetical protein